MGGGGRLFHLLALMWEGEDALEIYVAGSFNGVGYSYGLFYLQRTNFEIYFKSV